MGQSQHSSVCRVEGEYPKCRNCVAATCSKCSGFIDGVGRACKFCTTAILKTWKAEAVQLWEESKQ